MKRILFAFFILASTQLSAQISFKTGDSGMDAELNIINKDANSDLKTFKAELSAKNGLTISVIDSYLKIMQPAEVWLATKIAEIIKKPVDTVVSSYKVNKDKGWGEIAKDLGIKPGSAEFHELKAMTKKKNGKSGKSKTPPKTKGKK